MHLACDGVDGYVLSEVQLAYLDRFPIQKMYFNHYYWAPFDQYWSYALRHDIGYQIIEHGNPIDLSYPITHCYYSTDFSDSPESLLNYLKLELPMYVACPHPVGYKRYAVPDVISLSSIDPRLDWKYDSLSYPSIYRQYLEASLLYEWDKKCLLADRYSIQQKPINKNLNVNKLKELYNDRLTELNIIELPKNVAYIDPVDHFYGVVNHRSGYYGLNLLGRLLLKIVE